MAKKNVETFIEGIKNGIRDPGSGVRDPGARDPGVREPGVREP
jgi:hypothetical protein